MGSDSYEDRDLAWLRAEARNRKIPGWAAASRDTLIMRLVENDERYEAESFEPGTLAHAAAEVASEPPPEGARRKRAPREPEAGRVVDARDRFGASRDALADALDASPRAGASATAPDVGTAAATARALLVERDALRAVVEADSALDEAERVLDDVRKRWKQRVDDAHESLRVAIEAGRKLDDLGARAAREKLAAIEEAWQHLAEETAGRRLAVMEAKAAVDAAGGRRATAIAESRQLRFDF